MQVQAVGELIKVGKIKNWGLCNETAYGVTMFCETANRLGVPLPITIQNDYSLCDRCACLLCCAGVPSHAASDTWVILVLVGLIKMCDTQLETSGTMLLDLVCTGLRSTSYTGA